MFCTRISELGAVLNGGENAATIFVVEDDACLREVLVLLIESAGFKAQSWHSAEAFLADFNRPHRGCLLLDVELPGMSGIELAKKLKRDQIGLPIILLSGRGDLLEAARASRLSNLQVMAKPFHNNELLYLLKNALEPYPES